MSKIRLHGSSSGYTEIAPVAASGNNTLTLPNDGTIISKDAAGAIGVTSVHTTNITATGIATITTAKIGAGVTISESGIEASGIGITCANINRGQIGGRRNIIINGAAMVAQRGDTISGVTGDGYATDRFQAVMNSSGTLTISQDSDAPGGTGFRKCHRLTQTTAQGSLGANDLTTFRYSAEGYDLQGFKKGGSGAEEFTVSFWVKSVDQSSYPVTYILELRDPVNTRSCCKAYTVSASNTWEYKTITFPADTSGQWAASNAKALEMNWFVCAGSNYTSGTLSTTWATTVTANRAAGLTANLSANTANRFFLTGVQLEVGSQATAFEHRSFGEELALCQRYCYEHLISGANQYASIMLGSYYMSSRIYGSFRFPVTMRTAPTMVCTDSADAFNCYRDGGVDFVNEFHIDSSNNVGPNGAEILNDSDASGTAGQSTFIRRGSNSTTTFRFEAEL